MPEAWIAARFIHFVTAMMALGIGAFRLYAIPAGAPLFPLFDRALTKVMVTAAIIAFLSAFAIIPCTAVEMVGTPAAAMSPAIWRVILLDTAFGHVWCWHLGFAAILVAISALPAGWWQVRLAALAALLVVIGLGWVGHAAMDAGRGLKINQMLHLAAAGIWLGGLLALGLLLHRAMREPGHAHSLLARDALRRFSRIGYVVVAIVALTGAIDTIVLVGSMHAFLTTPYGRLLGVKIALFALMVVLALVNRFWLVPRTQLNTTAPPQFRALLRSVFAEQAIGFGILGAVSVLGTWSPANVTMPM